MTELVAILAALLLLCGFLALTRYEAARGGRVLARAPRARLDQALRRLAFLLAHVDFASFAREELARLFTRASQAAVHRSLEAVRVVERLLTRLVRHLRMHQSVETASREASREFVKTLSDFKSTLTANLEATEPR